MAGGVMIRGFSGNAPYANRVAKIPTVGYSKQKWSVSPKCFFASARGLL